MKVKSFFHIKQKVLDLVCTLKAVPMLSLCLFLTNNAKELKAICRGEPEPYSAPHHIGHNSCAFPLAWME